MEPGRWHQNVSPSENAWEEDIFRRFYLKAPHSMLYYRLRLGSPEFRRYFMRLFVDVMNHRLSSYFLQERLDYYTELTRYFKLDEREFNEEVAQSFVRRKPVLRQQMDTYFASGPSFSCVVSGPSWSTFENDGYPQTFGYSGWSFRDPSITLVVKNTPQQVFSHWLINETEIRRENLLRYTLESDTRIKAVFLTADENVYLSKQHSSR